MTTWHDPARYYGECEGQEYVVQYLDFADRWMWSYEPFDLGLPTGGYFTTKDAAIADVEAYIREEREDE